ncbi:MAG TPA: signal peptidase I, partial [Planctomycetota bacterium]|nr:signal peptidase I [Planctomycetota bacterium]
MSPHPAHRRTPWRDNVEALAMAIVLALVLKAFVLEAYKIPTGSMQPTLMGLNHSPGGGRSVAVSDRILVDKLTPLFRAPERWEVVVFRYPLDRATSFVKRIVGVPGDTLRIRDGDLQTRDAATGEWRAERRPDSVQRSMWKRLDERSPAASKWSTAGAERWSAEGR